MKKQFLKKLKSRAGETLVESLFAILIATFASIMLAGATSTAMELNRQARERDRVNQLCLEKLAKEESVVKTSGTLKVTRMQEDSEHPGKLIKLEKDGAAITSNVAVTFSGCQIDEAGTLGDFGTYVIKIDDEEEEEP